MSHWLIPIQRASSVLLWLSFVLLPLLVAVITGIGATFLSEDSPTFVPLLVFSGFLVAMALGSAFFLFPVFAWAFRGQSRPWLNDVADSLGGVPRYPSMFWPMVSPHLDTTIDGKPARIAILRMGGILGPPVPGDRRAFFLEWMAFATVYTHSPARLMVVPAGGAHLSFGRSLRPVAAPATGLDWCILADNAEIGARVAADPDGQEVASRLRAYPGRGVASVGRRARWTGALAGSCSPAATAGMMRDLGAFNDVVVRSRVPGGGVR